MTDMYSLLLPIQTLCFLKNYLSMHLLIPVFKKHLMYPSLLFNNNATSTLGSARPGSLRWIPKVDPILDPSTANTFI